MIYLFLLILVILCVVSYFRLNRSRYRYNKNDIELSIEKLFRRGFNGASLFIEPYRFKKLSVWLHKYIESENSYGIGLFFHKNKYQKTHYNLLLKYCIQQNLNYNIAEEQKGYTPNDILYIDFGHDIKKASLVSNYILFNIFLIKEDTPLIMYLNNVSKSEELVTNRALCQDEMTFKNALKMFPMYLEDSRKQAKLNKKQSGGDQGWRSGEDIRVRPRKTQSGAQSGVRSRKKHNLGSAQSGVRPRKK